MTIKLIYSNVVPEELVVSEKLSFVVKIVLDYSQYCGLPHFEIEAALFWKVILEVILKVHERSDDFVGGLLTF